ncbi:hypothetical protein FG99_23415 [Pseudomonas sp. AAC]|nr:hypothetical protein FG99_23415 [Pseudomonas sp. AAC]OHR78614.1 hypothetical protein HMPREF3289_02740 [Pseudomonas sp. HMSC75E02]
MTQTSRLLRSAFRNSLLMLRQLGECVHLLKLLLAKEVWPAIASPAWNFWNVWKPVLVMGALHFSAD